MNAGFFQRWYDCDVQLSGLVESLEALSGDSQTLFALLMTFFSDEIVRVKGNDFFAELEWDKIVGIYKSKRGRRWYDREPLLQKAFNMVYSLNDDAKAAIAKELYVPSRIVKDYESHCQRLSKPTDLDMICKIVETSFKEGHEKAQERYASFDELV